MRADIFVPAGPSSRSGDSVYPPVLPRGPLLVAKRLRTLGYTSRVIDGYSFPHIASEQMAGAFAESDLLAISVHGAPAIEPAISIATIARRSNREIPILFGGNLARVSPESLLPYLPSRSAILCGADTESLREVVSYLKDREAVPRIFKETVRAPNPDEWRLASVDCLVPSFKAYLTHPDFEYHLSTQEGCPYRCFHCGTGRPGLLSRVHYRPIESIDMELDGLRRICESLAVPAPKIWIADETFASDPEHARAVAQLFERSEVSWKWRAQTRLDCSDETSFRSFARAGCYKLAFGVEIPTTAGLQLLGKREEMVAAAEAFRAARSASVQPEAILVLATPGDTAVLTDIAAALDSLGAESVQSYIYHPVPGSPWWRLYHPKSVPSIKWWSSLDFHSSPITHSDSDSATVIATYLALQLWKPGRSGSAHTESGETLFSCGICGEHLRLIVLFTLAQTVCLEVRGLSSATVAAWNPEDAEALIVPRNVAGNLHAAVVAAYPVHTLADLATTACPSCFELASAREVA